VNRQRPVEGRAVDIAVDPLRLARAPKQRRRIGFKVPNAPARNALCAGREPQGDIAYCTGQILTCCLPRPSSQGVN
jgi:hypothetical protein